MPMELPKHCTELIDCDRFIARMRRDGLYAQSVVEVMQPSGYKVTWARGWRDQERRESPWGLENHTGIRSAFFLYESLFKAFAHT
jgi:hypothetical protein